MQRANRTKRILLIIFSLLLALTLCATFYYFKIKQNSNYQNQLHFRELKDINTAFNNSVSQLKNYGEERNRLIKENNIKQQIEHSAETFNGALNETQHRWDKANLQKQVEIESDKAELEKMIIEGSALQTDQTLLEKTEQHLQNYQKELVVKEANHLDAFENLIAHISTQFTPYSDLSDNDINPIKKNCSDDDASCLWLSNIIENMEQLLKQAYSRELTQDNLTTQLNNIKKTYNSEKNSIEGTIYQTNIKHINNEIEPLSTALQLLSTDIAWLTQFSSRQTIKNLSDYKNLDDIEKLNNVKPSESVDKKLLGLVNSTLQLQYTITNTDTDNTNKATEETLENSITLLINIVNSQIRTFTQNQQSNKEESRILTLQKRVYQKIKSNIENNLSTIEEHFTEALTLQAGISELKQIIAITRNAIEDKQKEVAEFIKDEKNEVETKIQKAITALNSKQRELDKTELEQRQVRKNNIEQFINKQAQRYRFLDSTFDFVKVATKTVQNDLFSSHIQCLKKLIYTLLDAGCNIQFIKDKEQPRIRLKEVDTALKNLKEIDTTNSLKKLASFSGNKLEHVLVEQNRNFLQGNFISGSYEVPLIDFLGDDSTRYPLIILTDEHGHALTRKENPMTDASLHGAAFEQVNHLLEKIFKQQKPKSQVYHQDDTKHHLIVKHESDDKKNNPGYSGYLDIEIAGADYRVFISPLVNNQNIHFMIDDEEIKGDGDNEDVNKNDNSTRRGNDKISSATKLSKINQMYLVAIKKKSILTSAKLNIPYSWSLIAILVFISLIAFVPLLKIRFISINQPFSPFDRHSVVIAVITLTIIACISSYGYVYYNKQKQNIAQQSRAIFIQIRNQFNQEVNVLTQYAQRRINAYSREELFGQDDYSFPRNDNETSDAHNNLFLENLFILSGEKTAEESAIMNKLALWSTPKLARDLSSNNPIPLISRKYATKALKGELWDVTSALTTLTERDKCSGLYIERLNNLRDSRLTTQFSTACNQEQNRKQDKLADVISFGTKLQTFFAAKLPSNFGFVVYTPKGQVLYHSDDKNRSLVENFFVETDNNSLFKAINKTPYSYNQPINFDATYSGKKNNFSVGNLYPNVPWKLAVFYKKEESSALNLIATLITTFICLALAYFCYICFVVVANYTNKKFYRNLLWPSAKADNYYSALLLTLIFIMFIVLATDSICQKVFEHHNLRYQQIINAEFGQALHLAQKEQNKYRQLLLEPNTPFKKVISNSEIPCYLGYSLKNHTVKSQQQCSIIKKGAKLDNKLTGKRDYWAQLIEYFWYYLDLVINLDDQLTISKKLNSITNKASNGFTPDQVDTYLNRYSFNTPLKKNYLFQEKKQSISLFSIIPLTLLVALVFYCYLIIIKHWIFKRLLGFNLPTLFRHIQSNHMGLIAFIQHGYLQQYDFIQVIRPGIALKNQLDKLQKGAMLIELEDIEAFYKLKLLENEIVDVSSWQIAEPIPNYNAEWIVKELTKSVILSSTNNKSILLEGFETISGQPELRRLVLEILEQLVAIPHLNIILLCQVSPLTLYIEQNKIRLNSNQNIHDDEILRWASLLNKSNKIYDWNADLKYYQNTKKSSAVMLIHESTGWPELAQIWQQFCQYNKTVYGNDYFDKLIAHDTAAISALIKPDDDEAATKNKLDELQEQLQDWQPKQIIEFFSANANEFYRVQWELCTKEERVLLYQISNKHEPNPKNFAPLERLTRNGYIYRDHGWHVINHSFSRFIKQAESEETMNEWLDESHESIWRYLRIPFFALLIAFLAIMTYTATDAIESAIGILAAILGVIPLALRNLTLFKGG